MPICREFARVCWRVGRVGLGFEGLFLPSSGHGSGHTLVDRQGRRGSADSNALVVGNVAVVASNPLALGIEADTCRRQLSRTRGTRLSAADTFGFPRAPYDGPLRDFNSDGAIETIIVREARADAFAVSVAVRDRSAAGHSRNATVPHCSDAACRRREEPDDRRNAKRGPSDVHPCRRGVATTATVARADRRYVDEGRERSHGDDRKH